jgi:hypothetical protein
MLESKLEDIAQITGVIDYGDVFAIEEKAETDKAYRKEVRAIIGDWEDAAEEEDEDTMEECAKKLKALVPTKEA